MAGPLDGLAALTRYAWEFRYPGESAEPSLEEAHHWLLRVRQAVGAVLDRLPRQVAQPGKVLGQCPGAGGEPSAASNAAKGAPFEEIALAALRALTGIDFERRVKLSIPAQPGGHCFDLVSVDRVYVGECKAYAFTAGGNIPSAKIKELRDAVRDLQQLPHGTKRFIVMKRSVRRGHAESLAEYFARTDASRIGDVGVVELTDIGDARVVSGHLV